ncbi:MAG: proline--tRNA ligase [Coriobacteriales bacterium]|jgi:prolyl-tRNA synthetase|nr:proline--tRNA ligase [Coriobacteriales bacterium]
MSELYAPTLREDPVDAEIASHRLLVRAAMIRKVAAGVYSFLPLGMRVLAKVEAIVAEEMAAIGSQEMRMSVIQPAELWHESGRWDDYGPELMRLEDRHGHSFALAPTHEELITALIRNELRSYRELPKSLYHFSNKYRDEIRPRFGLLRAREFIMKDAYSFHVDQASLQEHYEQQARAYGRICERLGLTYFPVEADSGQIGGKVTIEFMALAEAGEAELVYCDCGYAANTEVAEVNVRAESYAGETLREIHTPIEGSIASLAKFLSIPESQTVKALAGCDLDGRIVVLFIPGDHELGPIKALRAVEGFELLTDEEMEAAGLARGYLGPVDLPGGVRIIADRALQSVPHWLVGANREQYHLSGARPGRDFEVDAWVDLTTAQSGDRCPLCGRDLKMARGIEVGQVFQLGTKYSESMGAQYMDEEGNEKPFVMGCYGWGVTRCLAAVVEQYNDEDGIFWPVSVAPAEVCVVPLAVGDNEVVQLAERLAGELAAAGVEVVIDDRDERAGVKFADADLIGWPYQLVIGKRGLAAGEVELKTRENNEKQSLPLEQSVDSLVALIAARREAYA